MCGICAIFDTAGDPIDRESLGRMNASIQHRGPDGEGLLVDREVGLGHRRLSIIDLGGGGQPIGNEDGRLQVVFNGEIYNFVELRQELEGLGHVFKTRSDTEVIVHAYEQWGRDCVRRFNGMFAFALWDATARELFLARDHLGIKPLYYTQRGNRIYLASEIKAILQNPECKAEVDLDALGQLFTFRYVPSPRTLFRGILKLPPAHRMTVSRAGIRIDRYWDWIPKTRTGGNEAEWVEEYQHLLTDAVRLQLRSDVPLGLFLSSGIDSGVLLALMREHLSGPILGFTIGFEGGERTNEVEDARALADRFGCQHHFHMLSASDYMQYYQRYMGDLEEPVGNETAAAFYFVAREARRHVKVVLTGQGADEPWAGYDRYVGVKLSGIYSRMPQFVTHHLGPLAARLPNRMERLKRGVSSLAEPDILTRFTKIYSFFSADLKAHLYEGALRERHAAEPYAPREALRRLHADVAHLDPLSQILYIDTRASLPDDLLMVGDKTSMANSLEARVPFLDYRLVEFIEALPPNVRLRRLTGKYLHKKALLKWLPPEVVYRKKKGFDNPIEDWFRTGMRAFVEDCLLSAGSSMRNYFSQDRIRWMLEQDRLGREQFRRHIYLLVSLELWHRAFISPRP